MTVSAGLVAFAADVYLQSVQRRAGQGATVRSKLLVETIHPGIQRGEGVIVFPAFRGAGPRYQQASRTGEIPR